MKWSFSKDKCKVFRIGTKNKMHHCKRGIWLGSNISDKVVRVTFDNKMNLSQLRPVNPHQNQVVMLTVHTKLPREGEALSMAFSSTSLFCISLFKNTTTHSGAAWSNQVQEKTCTIWCCWKHKLPQSGVLWNTKCEFCEIQSTISKTREALILVFSMLVWFYLKVSALGMTQEGYWWARKVSLARKGWNN